MSPTDSNGQKSAQDEVAVIRRALALYCHYVDQGDSERCLNLFTIRATITDGPETSDIRTHLSETFASQPDGLQTKHFLGASEVRVQGDSAEAISDVMVLTCLRESSWSINGAGRYLDRLTLEDGEWRIAERRIEIAGYELKSYSA